LAYERQQQFELSLRHAQAAAKLEPSNPHPWVALAIAFWGKGDKPQAMQAYRQAIRLDGRYRDRKFLSHLQEAGFSEDQIARVGEVLKSNSSG
jgi:cytochrome c-type biogenesis protein CcmH/NrfG